MRPRLEAGLACRYHVAVTLVGVAVRCPCRERMHRQPGAADVINVKIWKLKRAHLVFKAYYSGDRKASVIRQQILGGDEQAAAWNGVRLSGRRHELAAGV